MKKLFFIAAFFAFATSQAQLGKVVSAYNYLLDYQTSKDGESLTKAKEAIDQAAEHEKTKDDAKTFVYKGQIYLAIFENNHRVNMDKLNVPDPNKKMLDAYEKTPAAELAVAYQAFKKAKELDVKNKFSKEITDGNEIVAMHLSNKGLVDYNNKKYNESLESYEIVYNIKGASDTAIISNCAIVAMSANKFDQAKIYYQKLIDAKAGRGTTYKQLVDLFLETKDTAAAMAVLAKGRAAYPNDLPLLNSETNYYLSTNNSEKALVNLNQAIQANPGDATLYYVRASTYDNMANPKDAKQNDLAKPQNYNELLALAEKDYKKAIEIDAKHFSALFNLGALYFNDGVYIINNANNIKDATKAKSEENKANALFAKALPPLEKALEVSPNDRSAMTSLKQIYLRLGQTDKYNAMNERLKAK